MNKILDIEQIKNMYITNSLQTGNCNASMMRVFNFIKDKTIDESKINVLGRDEEPPSGIAKWYRIEDEVATIGFVDMRQSSVINAILLSIHDTTLCCNNNPVKYCICPETITPCILTIRMSSDGMATATATISGGVVTGITIINGGSGYVYAPFIQITGGNGTGATATATISGGVVTGITIINGGSGYISIPIVIIDAPISTDIPNDVIDYAMSTLPIVKKDNILLYIGLAGLLALYIIKKK